MFECSDKNGYRIASPALGRTLTLQAAMRALTTAALTWPAEVPAHGAHGCNPVAVTAASVTRPSDVPRSSPTDRAVQSRSRAIVPMG
jgi:hypothetical protein